MRRVDSFGAGTTPSIADIANCETKTGFLIDLSAHEYRNYKVVKFASEAQLGEYLKKTGRTAVQVESKTVDTGERKEWTLFVLSIGLASRYRWLDTAWSLFWLGLLIIVGVASVIEIFRHRHDTDGYVGYRGVPRWFVRLLGDDEEYRRGK